MPASLPPPSSPREFVRFLEKLTRGISRSEKAATPDPAALYIAWDGDLLNSDESISGELLMTLKALLPQPGTMDLLVRESSKTFRLELTAEGGMSFQERPGLDLGPETAVADWQVMKTLVLIPRLRDDLAGKAIASYVTGPGREDLLQVPFAAGLTVLSGTELRARMLVRPEGPYRTLVEKGAESRWFHAIIPLQPLAEEEKESQLELTWIAPVDGNPGEPGTLVSSASGEEWPSPLRGSLRAPWYATKEFTDDPWNLHLFDEAARALLGVMQSLSTANDPGRCLDLLPTDSRHPLAAALWEKMKSTPMIPDATGTLRLGHQLWRHPFHDRSMPEEWSRLAGPMAHRRVIHPSCEKGRRSAILDRWSELLGEAPEPWLVDSPRLRRWEAAAWFTSLHPAGPGIATKLLELAQRCAKSLSPERWLEIRAQLPVILSAGNLYATAAEACFPVTGGFLPEGKVPVHETLANDPVSRAILSTSFGLTPPPGPEIRLAEALGANAGPALRALLQEPLPTAPLDDLSIPTLARIAIGLHGNAVLSRLAGVLREAGLQPPSRWGGHAARKFVRELGFPEAFAASSSASRPKEEYLMGPAELPPLHDFQQQVFDAIRHLVEQQRPSCRRAVVSLPTGGGKTRVAVQAAVDLILKPTGPRSQVLWIAQTDELCEQAVQAFRQVWASRGRSRTELRIIRMWGGNRTAPPSANGEPVAIITSIQTLARRRNQPETAWLKHCGMLVIDECHHANARTYAEVLDWIEETPESAVAQHPVILGLSATPFRNAEEQSHRLAERFDRQVFPGQQQGLYETLLERGVLSRATYRLLDSGTRIDEAELDALPQERADLNSVEFENLVGAINRKLANDPRRNEKIIDEISCSTRRSILLFANSRSHSRELAAMLIARGITAAAIDSETPREARRWILEKFQNHEIRVLCNHSVLTTGFDAPKVDMVFISRQIFSPVRYLQIVGRGLRGEANGGTAECEIVTVRDNWQMYGERLAWQEWRDFFLLEEPTPIATDAPKGRPLKFRKVKP